MQFAVLFLPTKDGLLIILKLDVLKFHLPMRWFLL